MANKEPNKDTVAAQIWEQIKEKPVNMFALPGQKVENFCKPAVVEPSKCYLVLTSTAGSLLPALEESLGSAFTVELAGKYIVVAHAAPSLA